MSDLFLLIIYGAGCVLIGWGAGSLRMQFRYQSELLTLRQEIAKIKAISKLWCKGSKGDE